jgi:hypothetical protein
MKSYRILAALVLAAAFAAGSSAVRAQSIDLPGIQINAKPKKPLQFEKFKGEVLHADSASIMVRDPNDTRFIHTFTYSPKVKEQMDKIIAKGGYQYGDKVVIHYQPGQGQVQDVAIAIKGKPSKPI